MTTKIMVLVGALSLAASSAFAQNSMNPAGLDLGSFGSLAAPGGASVSTYEELGTTKEPGRRNTRKARKRRV